MTISLTKAGHVEVNDNWNMVEVLGALAYKKLNIHVNKYMYNKKLYDIRQLNSVHLRQVWTQY